MGINVSHYTKKVLWICLHTQGVSKKCNPFSFEILHEIIKFESIWHMPSESTIYLLSNDT